MIGAAPDAEMFERLAAAALRRLPEPFAGHVRDVVIRVQEFASRDVLDDLGIEDEWGLTGLYQGHPLTEQSVWSSGEMPPQVTLYRQPLLAEWCDTGVTLEALITHVVVHEIGHHFGLGDDDMHALENQVR